MHTYIKKEHRNLLIKSECLKNSEYVDLFATLKIFEKIDDDNIDSLSLSNETRMMLSIKGNVDLLFDNAKTEWEYSPCDDINIAAKCQLCGQKVKTLFTIVNQFNGNSLLIGSSCITKYSLNSNYKKNYFNKLQRHISLRTQFYAKYPTIDNIIYEGKKFIDYPEYILPIDIYNNYKFCLNSIVTFKAFFLGDKKQAQELKKLDELLNRLMIAREKCNKWFIENSNDKTNISRNIYILLLKAEKNDVISDIMNNGGKVNSEIIKRIHFSEYAEKFSNEIEKTLEYMNVKSINSGRINGNLQFFSLSLSVYIHIGEFMKNWGDSILTMKKVPLKDYINCIQCNAEDVIYFCDLIEHYYDKRILFRYSGERIHIVFTNTNKYAVLLANPFVKNSLMLYYRNFRNIEPSTFIKLLDNKIINNLKNFSSFTIKDLKTMNKIELPYEFIEKVCQQDEI